MGLDYRTFRLLAKHVLAPHQPKSCVCLGRPHYLCVNNETTRLCEEFGIPVTPKLLGGTYRHRFADDMLRAFGISQLDHIDISPTDGTTIIHDLNYPIENALTNKFDLVLDNGTIEHIFNITQALENCASLCAIGGHFALVVPANNFCGHGFFQLSPEFFFRAFSESNGFADAKVVLLEYGVRNRDIYIVDPALKGQRHEFINSAQVVMLGIARKIQHKVPLWTTWPQQSDYVVQWRTEKDSDTLINEASKLEVSLLNHFPRLSRALQGIKFSGLNPRLRLKSNV